MALTKATYSMISGAVVNVLDYGADPTAATDSQAAFQAAVNAAGNGTVFVPNGNYKINTTVTLTSGITIKGAGQVAVNIISPAGITMFSLASSGATDLRGPNLFDMTLEADLVLKLNNTATFVDSNTGAIVGGSVKRCRFYNITSGVGQAINASQMFDTVISENKFDGTFNIAILMNGCDINTISHNRFTGFTGYGILDVSAQTYGSSNMIEHNDMTLQTNTNATFIKSNSHYIIIKDNYLEQIGAGSGIGIDCILSAPTFGTNVSDNPYAIWIENNRIEPETNFQYCVRLDPTKAQIIVCKNPSSTVAAGTSIFNTTGNLLPMASNNFVVPSVEISGQSWGVWDDYKSSGNVYSVNGGFCADGTTKDAFPYTSVGNYNASVSLLGKNIVMASPLVGGNRVVITPNPTSNTYFPAVTITVTIIARTTSASGDTLTASYIDDTNGPTSIVSCSLTQQYQKFTGTFTGYGLAFTKAGILLNRATTNGNTEILSVFWSY
jgi:hypothetical protein